MYLPLIYYVLCTFVVGCIHIVHIYICVLELIDDQLCENINGNNLPLIINYIRYVYL